jgi:hypothetical protein
VEPLKRGESGGGASARCIGRRAALGLSLSGLGWLAAGRLGIAAEGRGPGEAGAREGGSGPDQAPMSLIVLWLDGGPSQLETFDPKPSRRVAGPGRSISTKVPGLSVGEGLPQVAEQADKIAVLRGVMGKEGDHERATILMKTGRRPEIGLVHPALGAICAAELPEAGTEIPRYVAVLGSGRAARGGYLGQGFDAFRLGDPREPLRDVAASVPEARLDSRLADLERVERAFADAHPGAHARAAREAHEARTARALRTMRSPQLGAFRVEEEPAATLRAYGDTPFGRGCLAARRLVEVGVRCVEVSLDGWDTHIDHFEANARLCAALDPAFAALLRDLTERDLLRRTVVLCAGEFGRTPAINAAEGRDHWPHGFSLAMAGGPIRGGIVVGETGPDGEAPPSPIAIADVGATVLTAMGIAPEREHETAGGRPVKLSDGKAIAGVVG